MSTQKAKDRCTILCVILSLRALSELFFRKSFAERSRTIHRRSNNGRGEILANIYASFEQFINDPPDSLDRDNAHCHV
jgi:hypothetical protein